LTVPVALPETVAVSCVASGVAPADGFAASETDSVSPTFSK